MIEFFTTTPFIAQVYAWADEALKNQYRRGSRKEPYIRHSERVAGLLQKCEADDPTVGAALLHDVNNDGHLPLHQIFDMFGVKVGKIAARIHTPLRPSDIISYEERFRSRAIQILSYDKDVRIAVGADVSDNVWSIKDDPPIDWTPQRCLEFLTNSKMLYEASCKGISPFLDKFFESSYTEAYDSQSMKIPTARAS